MRGRKDCFAVTISSVECSMHSCGRFCVPTKSPARPVYSQGLGRAAAGRRRGLGCVLDERAACRQCALVQRCARRQLGQQQVVATHAQHVGAQAGTARDPPALARLYAGVASRAAPVLDALRAGAAAQVSKLWLSGPWQEGLNGVEARDLSRCAAVTAADSLSRPRPPRCQGTRLARPVAGPAAGTSRRWRR